MLVPHIVEHLLEIPWDHFVELEGLVARHSLSWKSKEAWGHFRCHCYSLFSILVSLHSVNLLLVFVQVTS